MKQTRFSSLIESFANIFVGYAIAIISQVLIFPLYGIHIPLSSNIKISIWFTIISIIRSYCVRRWFNARIHWLTCSITSRYKCL